MLPTDVPICRKYLNYFERQKGGDGKPADLESKKENRFLLWFFDAGK